MTMFNIAGAQHVRWSSKTHEATGSVFVTVEVWGSKNADGRFGSYTSISFIAQSVPESVRKGGEVGVEGEMPMNDYTFGSTVSHLEASAHGIYVVVGDGGARFVITNKDGIGDGWITITAADAATFKEIK